MIAKIRFEIAQETQTFLSLRRASDAMEHKVVRDGVAPALRSGADLPRGRSSGANAASGLGHAREIRRPGGGRAAVGQGERRRGRVVGVASRTAGRLHGKQRSPPKRYLAQSRSSRTCDTNRVAHSKDSMFEQLLMLEASAWYKKQQHGMQAQLQVCDLSRRIGRAA